MDELINFQMLSWDLSPIASCISDLERGEIQNMRLYRHLIEDVWTWLPNKKGKFSVKSAYRFVVYGHEYDNNHQNQIMEARPRKCI